MKTQEITVIPYEEVMRELGLRIEKAGSIAALAAEEGVNRTIINQTLNGSVQPGPTVLKIIGVKPERVFTPIGSSK